MSSEKEPGNSQATAQGSNVKTINDVLMKYDKPWWRIPHFIHLNFAVFLLTISSTTNGYDGSMLNGLQSLENWRNSMGTPKGAILGALGNGTLFGSFISSFIAPWIADKIGRRKTVYIGQVVMIIGAILQGVSTDYAFFMVARLILGSGSTLAAVGAASLISEIAYPGHRSIATAAYNICWPLGSLIAAGVTYGTRDMTGRKSWSIPSFMQGALPLFQVCFLWLCPESPRYLINKGRIEEAVAVLKKFHVGNSDSAEAAELIEFEMAEIETAIEMEKLQGETSFLDFFKTAGNRKRLFIVSYVAVMQQFSGNGLVSYYLNLVLNSIGITGSTQQLRINVGITGFNFACAIVAAIACQHFRRRHMFLTSVVMMLVTYIVWTILSAINQKRDFEDKSYGKGVLAMIFIYNLSYNVGLIATPILYMTECLSYSLRTKGLAIWNICTNLILAYNGFVNPIAMDSIQWKYYIVWCCIIACELPVVYYFFPETYGYTLEEVGAIFGDDITDSNNVLGALRSAKQSVEYVEDA